MFENFPSDLIPHVISFFSLEEIYFTLQFVCKDWMLIANAPTKFRLCNFTSDTEHQSWAYHLVSSFRNGGYFIDEINESDDQPPMWNNQHFKLIFSIIEGNDNSSIDDEDDMDENGMITNIQGLSEMMRSIYDQTDRFTKREERIHIQKDIQIEKFINLFKQERENGKNVEKVMNLIYFESNFKHIPDKIFFYKLFERVFSLDLDNDWSSVFPCIKRCVLLKRKSSNDIEREVIRKMFHEEVEFLLEMIVNILRWDFRQENLDLLYAFAHYCFYSFSNQEIIVKLSNVLIKEINRAVLTKNPILPFIQGNISEYPSFENNRLIELLERKESTLDLLDFKSIYVHASYILELLDRYPSLRDYFTPNIYAKNKNMRNMTVLQSRLMSYFTMEILNETVVQKRAELMEKLEQVMVLANELNDFSTAIFFKSLLEEISLYRLVKTRNLISRTAEFLDLYRKANNFLSNNSLIASKRSLSSCALKMAKGKTIIYHLFNNLQYSAKLSNMLGNRDTIDSEIVKTIAKKDEHQPWVIELDKEVMDFFMYLVLNFQVVGL